jgi:hypothetical protein
MLEGLAAGILSSYLGAWIEGLQRENLKIGIKQGNVTIENLKLRKEALRDLNLPIAIKAGSNECCIYLFIYLFHSFILYQT